MTIDGGRVLGDKPVVSATATQTVDRALKPTVPAKRAEVRDRCNERRVDFAGGYSLLVRAYDDGVAYRWVTKLPGDITVVSEDVTLAFADDHPLYFPEETSFQSHQERQYKRLKISDLKPGQFSSLPAMADLGGGAKAVLTESDLFDYPGMDLTVGAGPNTLKGLFPAYPKKVVLERDRDEKVVEREDFIAKTRGTRDFPWRVLVITERDADLIGTDIVFRLASETTMTDTGWIKPGKVAWDWWNALNVYGVPFKSGVNTDTYKHYIDFAAENGLEYIILDEGWYKLGDLLSVAPGVDMEAHRRLREAEERRPRHVGDLEDARPADAAGARPVREVGREGHQGRLHAARRPVDGELLRARGARGGEAEAARRLPRRVQADGPLPDVAERRHERGRAGPRAEQVGRPGVAGQRGDVPVHADARGPGGLHAGRDDQRRRSGTSSPSTTGP